MLKKSSLHLPWLPLTVLVGLTALNLPALAYSPLPQLARDGSSRSAILIAGLKFKVPNVGSSGNREAGASRGQCPPRGEQSKSKQRLAALVPSNLLALTQSANPTFFFYLTEGAATKAEFILVDQEDEWLYDTELDLPDKTGVVSFKLPDDALQPVSLSVGEEYRWYIRLRCNSSSDRSGSSVAGGTIKRVQPSDSLVDLKDSEYPAAYAEAGLWQDTLASLADLLDRAPEDPALNEAALKRDWRGLLLAHLFVDPRTQEQEKQRREIADAEIVGSATVAEIIE